MLMMWPDTAFRQQRLKAWQPILTPKTVLPLFFVVGVIFAPIGGALLYASAKVREIRIDYSDCNATAPACSSTPAPIPTGKVSSHFKSTTDASEAPTWCKEFNDVGYGKNDALKIHTPTCRVQFTIPDDLGPPVLFYYQLTNFYQNHRRYVKSFDQDQLKGTFRTNSSISSGDCDPLQTDPDTKKAYYPCGLIANSLFNDTFHSPVLLTTGGSSDNSTYQMSNKGIAWSSDKDLYGDTQYKTYEVVPPPNWRERYPVYNETFPFPDLHNDEAFQVWMRTAGLPTFSKLALRNDDKPMNAGRYEVAIYDCE